MNLREQARKGSPHLTVTFELVKNDLIIVFFRKYEKLEEGCLFLIIKDF